MAPTPELDRGGLFLEGEDADRPVDLRQELETDPEGTDLAETLEAEIDRLRSQVTHDAEREILGELERGVGSGRLALPPIPQVVLRVQQLINSTSFHLGELAAEIELDPALATKVVGIANSPFYAGLAPSISVQDAVVRIGVIETRNILMAIMMRSRVLRVPGFESLTHDLWEHALATSVTARALAAHVGIEPDRAFLAGLIHDVGRVVLLSTAGEVQRRSRGQVRPDPLALVGLMQELHPLLGAAVAESWHLAPELIRAIQCHHDPALAPDRDRCFAHVLEVGDELARQIIRDLESDPQAEEIAAARVAVFGLDAETARAILHEAHEAFEELRKIL
ncbi:MAG: HDOD domain-containing protein [Myxococcota bacterium]